MLVSFPRPYGGSVIGTLFGSVTVNRGKESDKYSIVTTMRLEEVDEERNLPFIALMLLRAPSLLTM